MAWITYHISPIDFGWDNLQTVEEVAAKMAATQAATVVNDPSSPEDGELSQFLMDFKLAARHAKETGWEGDYRTGHEPRVFWLPVDGDFKYGFAWKQDNNGSTFVVSPWPLKWLGPPVRGSGHG
jgi:hypothetical protein